MPLNEAAQIKDEKRVLGELGPRLFGGGLIVGVLGVGLALIFGALEKDAFRHFAHSYVVSYCYFLALALGSIFVVGAQHLMRASWGVVIRRYAEIFASVIPWLAIGAIPVVLMAGSLYEWTDPELIAHDHLLQVKLPWLNMPFFIVRLVVYFAVWTWIALTFYKNSLKQDQSEDPEITVRMNRFAAPALLLGGFTLTFFAYDVLMSLDYAWFSTMFGVYYFAGAAVSGVALITLTSVLLQKRGILSRAITSDHYHDLGKLTFAFTLFWAYIAFSQYMLIWYANIPEETAWLMHRQEGGWSLYYLILLVGCFILPFAGLLSRQIKRRRHLLAFWAAWVLILRWFDIYWLVMPEYNHERVPLHLMDFALWIGLGGFFVALAAGSAGRKSLVPEGDPRLTESLRFENV